MKEIQSVVRDFITNHERHRRYIAMVIAMCMIVSVAVPFSLIKPAISQTGSLACGMEQHAHSEDCYRLTCGNSGHDHSEECYQLICEQEEHIHNQYCYQSEDDYLSMENYSIKLLSNENYAGCYIGELGGSIANHTYEANNTADRTYSVFKTTYSIDKDVFKDGNISAGGNTIATFQLVNLGKEGQGYLDISKGYSGTFSDKDGVQAGTYTISADGVVTLDFYESYLTAKNDGLTTNGCSGNIQFNAFFIRDENYDDDVHSNENNLQIDVTFPEKNFTLTKNGSVKADKGTIEWTVTVSSNTDSTNWSNYTVKDPMLDGATLVSSNPADSVDISGGTATFNGNSTGKSVTFTYSVPINKVASDFNIDTTETKTIDNTAELYDKNNDKKVGNNSNVTLSPLNITKSHTLNNGKITWYVNISNQTGLDLSTSPIYDEAFKTLDTRPHVEVTPQTVGYTYDKEAGTVTINGKATSVSISYDTNLTADNVFADVSADSNGAISNEAKISETKKAPDKVGYTGATLSKSAYLDSDGNITWTLTINNPSQLELKDVVIKDSMFGKNIDGVNSSQVTLTQEGNNYKITGGNTTASTITVTYKTKLSDSVTGGININGGYSDKNTAQLEKGGNHTAEVQKDVKYDKVSISSKSGEVDYVNRAINWTITVNNPYGLDLSNHKITDSMFQYMGNSSFSSEFGSISGSTFTFNDKTKDHKTITIEYTTPLSTLADKGLYNSNTGSDIPNEAKFDNKDDNTSSTSVHVAGNVGLNKNGVFDYNYAPNYTYNNNLNDTLIKKYQSIGDNIVWSIDVTANYGTNLSGVKVVDEHFNNNFTVINRTTGEIITSGYDYDSANHTLTITGESLTNITIVYATSIDDVWDVSKNCYYNGVNIGDLKDDWSVTGEYKPYGVTKRNSVSDGLVEWRITVTSNGQMSLDGMEVKDIMLKNAIAGSITVQNAEFDDYSKTDSKIILKNTTSKSVIITYKTRAVDTSSLNKENPTSDEIATISGTKNDVTITKDNKDYDTAESVQGKYVPKNELSKEAASYEKTDADGSGTIDWLITSIKDNGFEKDFVITDNMSAEVEIKTGDILADAETDPRVGVKSGIHFMTEEQISNITVLYSDKSTNPVFSKVLPKACYKVKEVEKDGMIVGFKITLTDSITTIPDIKSIQVSYTSTANLSDVDSGGELEVVKVHAKNEAETSDHKETEPAEYEITKFNAKNQPFKKYGVDRTFMEGSGGTDILLDANASRTIDEIDTITIGVKKYYAFRYAITVDASRLDQKDVSGTGTNAKFNATIYDTLPDGFTLFNEDYGNDYENADDIYKTKLCYFSSGNTYNYYNYPYKKVFTQEANSSYDFEADGRIRFDLIGLNMSQIVRIRYTLITEVDAFNAKLAANKDGVQIANTISTDGSYEDYTDTQTVTPAEIPDSVQEDIVNKKANANNSIKNMHYSIEVNSGAKNLSSTGSLVLSDLFSLTSAVFNGTPMPGNISENFNIDLKNFKVTDMRSGEDVTDECSYTIMDSDPNNTNYVTVDNKYKLSAGNYNTSNGKTEITYELTGNQLIKDSNNKVKFTFLGGDYRKDETGATPPISFGNGYYPEGENGSVTYDPKTDSTTFEFVLNSDEKYMNSGQFQVKSYGIGELPLFNLEVSKPITEKFDKNLQITVPDGRYLKVEYDYAVAYKDEIHTDPELVNTVNAKNSVSVNTGSYYDNSSQTSSTEFMNNSYVDVQTKYLTIIKRDLNNRSAIIDAGFDLARWNNGKWEYARKTEATVDGTDTLENVRTVAEWGDRPTTTIINTTEGKIQVALLPGYIYKLEEANPPEGYVGAVKPAYFHVGETKDRLMETMKSGITTDNSPYFSEDSLFDAASDKELNVDNYQNIDVTAKKLWDDGTELHKNDYITVQLFKSNIKSVTGFPAEDKLYPVMVDETTPLTAIIWANEYQLAGSNSKISSGENPWTCKFENLPSGDEDNNHIYYYIKEVSYYIAEDGTEYIVSDGNGSYTPHYTNNAVNRADNAVVEVLNSCRLVVQKVWKNSNNEDITDIMTHDNITFSLYRTPEGGTREKVTVDGKDVFTLGKDLNNWTYAFDGLPATNSQGKAYKYSVEEVDGDKQFEVTYLNNATGNNGNLKIVNKDKGPETFKVEVNKQWADGNVNHNNDTITVELRRNNADGTRDKQFVKEFTVKASDNWEWSMIVDAYESTLNDTTGLLEQDNTKPYTYYFVETKINGQLIAGTTYTVGYVNNNITMSSANKETTITNTPPAPPEIDIIVNKTWGAGTNKPESITLELYKAYTRTAPESEWELYRTAVLTKQELTGEWAETTPHIFDNLPQYLYYHVKEVSTNTWIPTYTIDGHVYAPDENGVCKHDGFVIKGNGETHDKVPTGEVDSDGKPTYKDADDVYYADEEYEITVDIENNFVEPETFDLAMKKTWKDSKSTHDNIVATLIRSTRLLDKAKLNELANAGASSGGGNNLTTINNDADTGNIDAANVGSIDILKPTKNNYVALMVYFVANGTDVGNTYIIYQNGSWSEASYGQWNNNNTFNSDGSVTIKSTVNFDAIRIRNNYSNETIYIDYTLNQKSGTPVAGGSDFGEIDDGIEMYTKEEITLSPDKTYTIKDLPVRLNDTTPYYYYVIEKDVPNGYNVSYSNVEGDDVTPLTYDNNNVLITNEEETGSLKIEKKWIDENGTALDNYRDIKGVKVSVYQSTVAPDEIQSSGDDTQSAGGAYTWSPAGASGGGEVVLGTATLSNGTLYHWRDNGIINLGNVSNLNVNDVSKMVVKTSNCGFPLTSDGWENWVYEDKDYLQSDFSSIGDYVKSYADNTTITFYGKAKVFAVTVDGNVIGDEPNKTVSLSKGSFVGIRSTINSTQYTVNGNAVKVENGQIIVNSDAKVGDTATIKASADSKEIEIPVVIAKIKKAEAILPPEADITKTFGPYDIESSNWSRTFNNLPLQDADGNAYYYYIEEVSESDYYIPTHYSGSGVTLVANDIRTASVTNQTTDETPPEEVSVQLPMTGGAGTNRYYMAGAGILSLAVLGLVTRKRKRNN